MKYSIFTDPNDARVRTATSKSAQEVVATIDRSGHQSTSIRELLRTLPSDKPHTDGTLTARNDNGQERLFCASRADKLCITNDEKTASEFAGRQFNLDQLAVGLAGSIPYPLRARSVWEGVTTILPGEDLIIHRSGVADWQDRADRPQAPSEEADTPIAILTKEIEEHICDDQRVSCDLSGGLDSSLIAIILNELGVDANFLHIKDESLENNDYRYASRLARDLSSPLDIIGSSVDICSSFDRGFPEGVDLRGRSIPRWLGGEGHLSRVRSYHERSEHRAVHFTGLGGDELFNGIHQALVPLRLDNFNRLTYAHVLRNLQKRMSWGMSASRLLLAAAHRLSPQQEMERRIHSSTNSSVEISVLDTIGWFPGVVIPKYYSSHARDYLIDRLLDYSTHVTEEYYEKTAVAQFVVQMNSDSQRWLISDANADFGGKVCFRAPLLTRALEDLILQKPPKELRPRLNYKQLLIESFPSVLPTYLTNRTDKGDMSNELYSSYRSNQRFIYSIVKESALVDHGIADGDEIKRILSSPAVTTEDLMQIEYIVYCEKWLRVQS